jgi:putative Ca2+/H+ antiporter (TMEM165/GDT1 family)
MHAGIKSIMHGFQAGADNGELHEAEESMSEVEKTGKMKGKSQFASLWEVATIIFLAEWGDRSMMATIALAVHSNPYGVAIGATTGHVAATLIAVVGGALMSKYISERMVSFIGGALFLFFAARLH